MPQSLDSNIDYNPNAHPQKLYLMVHHYPTMLHSLKKYHGQGKVEMADKSMKDKN